MTHDDRNVSCALVDGFDECDCGTVNAYTLDDEWQRNVQEILRQRLLDGDKTCPIPDDDSCTNDVECERCPHREPACG